MGQRYGPATARARGHTAAIETVAVSPDDKYVVTGGWDETIRVWDAESGKEATVLRGELGNINAVAFSPEGDLLAAAGSGGVIRLWDTKTWTVVGGECRHPARSRRCNSRPVEKRSPVAAPIERPKYGMSRPLRMASRLPAKLNRWQRWTLPRNSS